MKKYIPQHERSRQAAIKRSLVQIARERRWLWRHFKENVKGELIGSPHYDAAMRHAMREESKLQDARFRLERQMPPYLVWNKAGYLEHKQVPVP